MNNYNKVKKKRELNRLYYLGTVTRGRRGWRRWERMEECWRDERVGIDLAAEKIDRERDPERHAISFFDFALEFWRNIEIGEKLNPRLARWHSLSQVQPILKAQPKKW